MGMLNRLKATFPIKVLETLYSSLIASYINYGFLLWGSKSQKIETLQNKAIRLITNSEFISHTKPLFIKMKILKIQDIFKLRLLKLYYKLSYTVLPKYICTYEDYLSLFSLVILFGI